MTDNGSPYVSTAHPLACRELGLRHLRTRPYRPRTNGKAERFIQTLTNRWAHGAIYASSQERTRALPGWLTHYNYTRRHGALSHKPPAARLNELNNLARNYS
jgi:transposase InsO family protein